MKISNRRQCSGHLEVILAVVIALMGIVWYFQSTKKQPNLAYYPQQQYITAQAPQAFPATDDPAYSGKLNKGLLIVAGGLIYVVGVMSGLFLPLLHSIRQKHHKVPFSLTHFLPTRGNRAMHFLDCLQQMRDTGLISKQEYESKRLEFLSKL